MEKLIGLFLEAEEFEENINMIVDSDVAFRIAKVLKDNLGKEFFYEDISADNEFEDLLIGNDILSVAVMYEDGHPLYFLQEAIYGDITAECDADRFYIQDDLLDCLDLNRLTGEINTIELEFDEEECEYDELEEILEEQTNELIEKILEDKDCVHCLIKESLENMYYQGYNDAIDKMQEKLYEL